MDTMTLAELRPIMPELFLCFSALFLLMVGAFMGNRSTPVVGIAAVCSLLMALYMETAQLPEGREVFRDMFESDFFTVYGKVLVLLGAAFMMTISHAWRDDEQHQQAEFPVLILFSVLGLMLMISAVDLLALYLGLELAGLAQYVLAASRRDDVRSSEAGLKYFVLGSLASGMMLFGISLIYGFTGTINFYEIATVISAIGRGELLPVLASYGLVTGMVLLLAGLCFKISAVPFHMWTPDVYEGAPTPVTAFFSFAPKVAALFLLTRVLTLSFGELQVFWQQIIVFAAVGSMLVGAFGALTQTHLKRLLAYSSIGHVGYALVGVAVGGMEGSRALVIYLSLYLFMTAGAFGCLLLMRRGGKYLDHLSDLSGISRTHPVFALALAVLLFSMAGIPPLAGFFGKMYVFLAAVESGMYVLAVLGVLTSVVAAYYYLKIVKIMYFNEQEERAYDPMSLSTRLCVGMCVVAVLLFVFRPSVVTAPARQAVEALYLL
jgi:NADH-quinone oxidoreductase subunit N